MAASPAMTIIWMPLAEGDLDYVYAYVGDYSEDAARRLIKRIFSAVEMLGCHPLSGRKGRVPDTRELVIPQTPYIVPYRIRVDEIQILAVIHGAQRWPTSFDDD